MPMILAAVLIAKNPKRYGFDLGPAEPLAYETVTVPGALDLHIIAEWAGVTLEDIQGLNPELRRTMTPTAPHEVKLPLGTAASVRAKLEGADPTLFRKFTFHTVTRGETVVASIAKKTKSPCPRSVKRTT
jgi:membrane-bound lytic murein transglycosylase D